MIAGGLRRCFCRSSGLRRAAGNGVDVRSFSQGRKRHGRLRSALRNHPPERGIRLQGERLPVRSLNTDNQRRRDAVARHDNAAAL